MLHALPIKAVEEHKSRSQGVALDARGLLFCLFVTMGGFEEKIK